MKITSSEAIMNGERELIDAITGELDWGAIEKIFRERHGLVIEENVEYRRGDIVTHNNSVAYKLEFEAKVTLSILLDREGNYLSLTCPEDSNNPDDKDETFETDRIETTGDAAGMEQQALSEGIDKVSDEDYAEDVQGAEETDIVASGGVPTPQEAPPDEKISQITTEIADMVSAAENDTQGATGVDEQP